MQTSVIAHRVTDFLKQYPPFQAIEDADLMALVSRGRVKFHESDEFIFWQGATHNPFLYVIQQGTVSLWETTAGGERLRDIRGAGDVIGIDRFLGNPNYLYSAKTNSDVVVYALPSADFEPLLERYAVVSRYVKSHAAVTTDYHTHDQRKQAHEVFVHESTRRREPSTCHVDATIREAARRLNAGSSQAMAVVDAQRRVVGVVTGAAILRWIGEAGNDPDRTVTEVMIRAPYTIAPQAMVSQCVLAMVEGGTEVLVATRDGTQNGELHSLITPDEVAPAFGSHPLSILKEIACTDTLEDLRGLQFVSRNFLFEQLTTPSSLDWLARYARSADTAILRRIVELNPAPEGDYCLSFWGAAGRQELLTSVAPSVAVLVADGASLEPFRVWGRQLESAMAGCYLSGEDYSIPVAAMSDWQTRFRNWIESPILHNISSARPYFDLDPALGNEGLWAGLQRNVLDAIRAEDSFVRVMANDCLSSLPPLTIFRDLVVEGTGAHSAVFQLEKKALQPIVDVARVFGIAAGCVPGSTSLARLGMARTMLPDHEGVFREAADTLRIVLYHQARAGIRTESDGAELPPAILSGHDRQVLKSGFRCILQLLEFTDGCRWLEAR